MHVYLYAFSSQQQAVFSCKKAVLKLVNLMFQVISKDQFLIMVWKLSKDKVVIQMNNICGSDE